MLKNRGVCLAVLSAFIGMIFMFFFDSILSEHLDKDMNIDPKYNGYFFGLVCFSYIGSAIVVGKISIKVKRRYLTQASFLITSIALFCFGPSRLLKFHQASLFLTLLGLFLLGLGSACLFVPILSEFIEAVQVEHIIGNSPNLSDKASSLFNAAYAFGCILAPILGATINHSL